MGNNELEIMNKNQLKQQWLEEEKVAHVIEWEFPGFTADNCLDELFIAQEILEKCGCIEGKIHRFMLIAKK